MTSRPGPSIADVSTNRLWIRCRQTGQRFLVDSGAEISCLTKAYIKHVTSETQINLYAANGSVIQTYGRAYISIDLGLRRTFRFDFIVANVESNLIGADFLQKFGLLVDIRQRRLLDRVTNFSITATISNAEYQIFTVDQAMDKRVKTLLDKYKGVITPKNYTIVKHNVKHNIITEHNRPVFTNFSRLSGERLQAAKNEIERLLERNIIRPSTSPWASRVTMVQKMNGQWRMCGDYREVNKITVPDRYPMPHIHDFTQSLGGVKVFSALDVVSAYHNIPMNEDDIQKTAIITPFGLYEYLVMPFGLRNSAQTFQRFMDSIFRGVPNVYVYIDDILIASKDEVEHQAHLEKVLKILEENGLTINTKKCQFFKDRVTYLGHTVDKDGVATSPEKIKAIVNFTTPESKSALRRFLGMVNFYRRFIRNAAHAMSTLHDLVTHTKGEKLEWTETADHAFKTVREIVSNCGHLAYIDTTAKLVLKTDASNIALGAVLEQHKHGVVQPLGFFSRKLRPEEQNYSTFDKELCAIFRAIKHFEYMLQGRQFKVLTDHKPLVAAFARINEKSPRQIRMMSYILEFTSDFEHVKGEHNVAADALSRVEIESIEFKSIDCQTIAKHQKDKPGEMHLTEHMIKQRLPGGEVLVCHVQDGIARPVIPSSLRKSVFESVHNLSHPSLRSTRREVAQRFYWPSMNTDVAEWCRSCMSCQSSKVHRHVKIPPTQIQIPTARFKQIDIDIVGPLPTSSEGYRYLLTVIDRFSRWTEAIKMRNIETTTVIRALADGWFSRFGIPEQIRTDRGTQFESALFEGLNRILGIGRVRTAAYSPRSNGMIERFHRTLKDALKASSTKDWEMALPWVMLGLRTLVKEDLNTSPAQMLYGEPIAVPADLIDPESRVIKEPAEALNKIMTAISDLTPTLSRQSNHGELYLPRRLTKCEHVWLRKQNTGPLEKPYVGPYKVLARGRTTYDILTQNGPEKVAVQRLKPAVLDRAVHFELPRRRGRPRRGGVADDT